MHFQLDDTVVFTSMCQPHGLNSKVPSETDADNRTSDVRIEPERT